jgi:hypothetical protein
MTRYQWPPGPGGPRGRSRARRADIASQAAGTNPAARPDALARRRSDLAEQAARPALAPGQPPGPATDLWLPMGPGTTVRGLADADPRVSGRMRDLAVSDDGARIYAGAAGGGVWYSGDGGISWLPVGTYTLGGDVTTDAPSSTTLAVGALSVRFGADASQDEVWVGTGEPDPAGLPSDIGVQANYGGVGILHATGPVPAVQQDPGTDPWEHGAQPATGYAGLRGQGVYAFAADPATPSAVIAGTSAGLHQFDPAAGPLTEPWSLVTVAAWDTALGAGGSGQVHVTDLAWVDTPAGPRLWVAVAGAATPAAARGLWRSDNGLAGPFTRVDLTGVTTDGQRGTLLNLGLAAAPADATVLYVLSTGPRLWRADGDSTVRRVRGLPARLYGDPPGQGEYDLAVAVDPSEPRRVVVGGASADSPLTPGTFSASLYRLTLQTPAPAGTADWHTDYAGNGSSDATWIGEGVHPDVHRLRWLPAAGGGGTRLHVACDGGVFVSAAGGDLTTFTARNTGLGATEAGYLDSHPTSDGPVLIGVQDNGTQLRIGDSVWRRANSGSDGGGVAFDPAGSGRMLAQDSQAFWRDDADTTIDPTFRGATQTATATEDGATRFYSNLAAVTAAGVTQVVLGTSRVWYSEQWFHTFWDNAATVWRVQAVTLPSFTDPRAGNANDWVTDVLEHGPMPPGTQDPESTGVRALRWAGPDRLYVLMPGVVHRLDRNPANRTWARTRILRRAAAAAPGGPPAPAVSGAVIPPEGMLNDLAVQDQTAGTHGSFYVASSNPLEPLWWFDGTSTWFPSGLGTQPPGGPGVRVPAYSVTVDPAAQGVVYVGTAAGVWRGTQTVTGGVPAWTWTALVNGLPEAAVQDLSVVRYPLAQGGTVRLLRAALQSRGAWECQLDTDLADLTYLRVHPYDTRRSRPTALADPLPPPRGADREWHLDWADVRARAFRDAAGRPATSPDGTPPGSFSWHASPDVRVRPAPGSPALAAPASLPWTRRPADRNALWALQTALHAVDPLIVPDGRWTAVFTRRLRALRRANGLSDATVVDAALWNHAAIAAGWWASPWDGPAPSEADLVERIVHRTTARPVAGATPEVDAPTVSATSCAVPAGLLAVDVCVHRRALQPLGPDGLTVLLLRTQFDPSTVSWAGLPALTVAGLGQAMAAVPLAGGPLGLMLPAGWEAADATTEVRRPAGPVAAAAPVVVSFQTNLPGPAGGWLLLAVIAAEAGSPELAGASLSGQVLGSPHLAARSVEIR